jgi:hypothetical protein
MDWAVCPPEAIGAFGAPASGPFQAPREAQPEATTITNAIHGKRFKAGNWFT